MQSKEQIFLYMKEEIERLAKKEEEQILSEAKELEQEAYESMKAEAKADASAQLNKELAEISSQASVEAAANLETRTKQLVEKRDGFVADIFNEAKEKLVSFASGNEYHDYLVNRVSAVSKEYQMENCVLKVREADQALKDELVKAYQLPVEVEVSQDILIGGFILENKTTHVVVDESLDFALESQKDWFYKTSGLMIR
ncbi:MULTISPECIES: V-type ATP synthase subunit E [Coprobacillaceae]|uniref:V-type ATP synthase subunit E n=1 Tax=Coprobacillaceae TaxID=2810280 RepID=UPI000E4BEC58|nr:MULTISPECIES: V-type ATP synthase subunit E [Coprobacillaceae]RHM60052.1 hypothetical protein DWZ53_08005 [Coprobacillus sp. AF33-1AC]RHS92648.1 hypothetical protein DW911_07965 [Erysipelatoclostridium sp. AM42-17]